MRIRLLVITAAAAVLFGAVVAAPAYADISCSGATTSAYVVTSCGSASEGTAHAVGSVGPSGGFRPGDTWCDPGPVMGATCTPVKLARKMATAAAAPTTAAASPWVRGPAVPSLAGLLFGGGILVASKNTRRKRPQLVRLADM